MIDLFKLYTVLPYIIEHVQLIKVISKINII